MVFVTVAVLASTVGGVAGSYVSAAKGRGGVEGAALGIAFGPVGVLIAVLLPTVDRGTETASREEREEDAAERRARRYLGGLIPADPDLNVLDQVGGARLTPEERARRDEKGIRALKAQMRVDAPRP